MNLNSKLADKEICQILSSCLDVYAERAFPDKLIEDLDSTSEQERKKMPVFVILFNTF